MPRCSSKLGIASYMVGGDVEKDAIMRNALMGDVGGGGMGGGISESPSAFDRWFSGSKVVNDDGAPLTVYKGMYPHDWTKETKDDPGPLVDSISRPTEFPTFDSFDKKGVNIGGFFGNAKTASRFADGMGQGAVYPGHLSLKNPYIVDANGKKAGEIQFGQSGKPFRDALRSGKYDGAIIKNTADEGDIYVSTKPHQFKSQFNRGTYDPEDPHMSHANGGGIAHFDGGGQVAAPIGIAQSTQTQAPIMQQQLDRYKGMTSEDLQEMAVRLHGTPQAQIINRVLQQKHMQGDDLPQMADGGAMGLGDSIPGMMPAPEREAGSGLLHSAVAGRTDHLQVNAPSGAYVIPADVVSGLGEGNTLAGARVLQEMFTGGPHGVPLPSKGRGRNTMPKPPAVEARAKGGAAKATVPILGAGGEFIVHPKDLQRKFGNVSRGHKHMDEFVVLARKKIAKEMLGLPGPEKS